MVTPELLQSIHRTQLLYPKHDWRYYACMAAWYSLYCVFTNSTMHFHMTQLSMTKASVLHRTPTLTKEPTGDYTISTAAL